MKTYTLRSPDELAADWKRVNAPKDAEPIDWALEETKQQMIEFFGGSIQRRRQLGEGGQKGTGVREGAAVEVSDNAPETEREASHVDISDRRSTASSLRPNDAAPEVG